MNVSPPTDLRALSMHAYTPATADRVIVSFGAGSGSVRFDGFQLELGEVPHGFADGYSPSSPLASYLKLPPDYLGCTGASTDPSECDSYAKMCTAQDVGCLSYTPDDGDPSVPAIVTSLDSCPSECVGYTTYKQEGTPYDAEEFPLRFIADKAASCSEQFVGCDGFTNLDALEAGGEGIETYSDLRSCITPEMADGSNQKTSSTYFTWEGSDNEGYQL